MQTLNLARQGYGSIDYEIIHFPDGQKHLRILTEINHKDMARIVCRITNGDDLFILMQAADVFNRHCLRWVLDIKYLLAARTDRLFSMDEAHSLNIVKKVIESLGAYEISVFEPHNNTTLKDFKCEYQNKPLNCKIAYPDAGANIRYSRNFGFGSAIVCGKKRNEVSGELIDFTIEEFTTPYRNLDIVLIDDLCDGGGTFLGLAPKLRELTPKTLTLQVAHAIQLQGILKVASVYDKVIITNSYFDWDLRLNDLPSNIHVENVLL